MTLPDIAFYAFSVLTIGSGLMMTVGRNPVHSVLWLILAFLSSAGLFVLLGAEFLAMLLIIVYVGAVAVLFLFVVMMLDVDFAALKGEMTRSLPLGLLVGVVLLVLLILGVSDWVIADDALAARKEVFSEEENIENTVVLGLILYDRYFPLFQLAGLILLVAMIGAIVLTVRHRKDVKRQNVLQQMWRDPSKSVELKGVKPGEGL